MLPPYKIEKRSYNEPAKYIVARYEHRIDRAVAREASKTAWGNLPDGAHWPTKLPLLSMYERDQAVAFRHQVMALQELANVTDGGLYKFVVDGLMAIAARIQSLAEMQRYFLDEEDWDFIERQQIEEAESAEERQEQEGAGTAQDSDADAEALNDDSEQMESPVSPQKGGKAVTKHAPRAHVQKVPVATAAASRPKRSRSAVQRDNVDKAWGAAEKSRWSVAAKNVVQKDVK